MVCPISFRSVSGEMEVDGRLLRIPGMGSRASAVGFVRAVCNTRTRILNLTSGLKSVACLASCRATRDNATEEKSDSKIRYMQRSKSCDNSPCLDKAVAVHTDVPGEVKSNSRKRIADET